MTNRPDVPPLRLRCFECRAVLRAPLTHAGKTARCPGCKNLLRVPPASAFTKYEGKVVQALRPDALKTRRRNLRELRQQQMKTHELASFQAPETPPPPPEPVPSVDPGPIAAAASSESPSRSSSRRLAIPRREVPEFPVLRAISGPLRGQIYLLGPDRPIFIGRGVTDEGIMLIDPDVSRLHAQIWRDGDGWRARDLESHNGIRINNERVTQALLEVDDRITVGGSVFAFERSLDEAETNLEADQDRATHDEWSVGDDTINELVDFDAWRDFELGAMPEPEPDWHGQVTPPADEPTVVEFAAEDFELRVSASPASYEAALTAFIASVS